MILGLLSLTFFLQVDDRFRGWDDTNQYQLEALSWAQGEKPPSKFLIQESRGLGLVMPKYYSPLTSYLWSFFVNPNDTRSSLVKIKGFQAFLMAVIFIGLTFLIDSQISFLSILLSSILLFTPFCRELISNPISEALALFLLIIAFIFPRGSSLFASLELMTRPVMVLLFIPILWKRKHEPFTYFLGIFTLLLGIIKFRGLLFSSHQIPAFDGYGLVVKNVVTNFASDSAYQYFDHLLPHTNPVFFIFWASLLGLLALLTIYKLKSNWVIGIPSLMYFLICTLWGPTGVRLLFPLMISFFIHFMSLNTVSKRIVSLGLFCLLFIHSIDRQIESGLEIWRDKLPETERGFDEIKTWLHQKGYQNDPLVMWRFRFCSNYFRTTCFMPPFNPAELARQVKSQKIHFLVYPNKSWQREDNMNMELLNNYLEKTNFSFDKYSYDFQGIKVLDLSSLR